MHPYSYKQPGNIHYSSAFTVSFQFFFLSRYVGSTLSQHICMIGYVCIIMYTCFLHIQILSTLKNCCQITDKNICITYIYIYALHIYIYIYICNYIYIYIYIYIYTYTYKYICLYMFNKYIQILSLYVCLCIEYIYYHDFPS